MYTSWLSKSFVLVIEDVSRFENLDCSGGLCKIPAGIGLDLGSKISKFRFSILLENPSPCSISCLLFYIANYPSTMFVATGFY